MLKNTGVFEFIDGGDGYYQISAKHSKKVLDVYASSEKNGARLIQYESTGKDNQLFKFVLANKDSEPRDLGPEY